jgi:hypothetical protein
MSRHRLGDVVAAGVDDETRVPLLGEQPRERLARPPIALTRRTPSSAAVS